MIRVIKHLHFWVLIVLLTADILFFSVTNPQKGSSIMLMMAFLLLAVTLMYICKGIMQLLSLYGFSFSKNNKRLPIYVSGVAIGLMALQSIGELSIKDTLIFIPLTIILYIYLTFGRMKIET